MKTIILFISCLILTASVAQVPQALNYQAVARNTAGAVLQNQHVNLRLSLHDGSVVGSLIYQETDTATTNQFGLFTCLIGKGLPTVGTFSGINWAGGNKFLEVELDPAGGNSFSSMGTTQLVTVPYALYAQNAAASASDSGISHHVGDLFGGGIVVAVWQQGGLEHGLIASLTDIDTGSVYSNISSGIPANGAQSPVSGSANTAAIIVQTGHTTSAALLCHNYNGGGYSDWYLPSSWELNQCYNAAFIVNTILGPTNGFAFLRPAYYWSSSENLGTTAWYQDFYLGNTNAANKNVTHRVRAVRRY